ncbi:hypothetical protein SAMN05421690_100211 [Nitrosomonas sp. Nm51]|nr:hypothetical protein SAMN05421690_100211 [Nitrosomonas sp. Nm51]
MEVSAAATAATATNQHSTAGRDTSAAPVVFIVLINTMVLDTDTSAAAISIFEAVTDTSDVDTHISEEGAEAAVFGAGINNSAVVKHMPDAGTHTSEEGTRVVVTEAAATTVTD